MFSKSVPSKMFSKSVSEKEKQSPNNKPFQTDVAEPFNYHGSLPRHHISAITPDFKPTYRSAAVMTQSSIVSESWNVTSGLSFERVKSKPMSPASWMPGTRDPGFSCPKLQPFYREDSMTKFETFKSADKIFSQLGEAMTRQKCTYTVDRENSSIALSCLVNHSRVTATWRVYQQDNGQHLVQFSPTYGDRIPATRLFYTLANDSGLLNAALQVPRLLRTTSKLPCCEKSSRSNEEKAGTNEAAAPAIEVYVDMLSSIFAEEVLVGAQGIARACCCNSASKPYIPHHKAFVDALQRHHERGLQGHLVCRDIVACLASIIEKLSGVLSEEEAMNSGSPVLEILLTYAASEGADSAGACACLKAAASICESSDTLKSIVLTKSEALLTQAVSGNGPCSINKDIPTFLQAPARKLKTILSL